MARFIRSTWPLVQGWFGFVNRCSNPLVSQIMSKRIGLRDVEPDDAARRHARQDLHRDADVAPLYRGERRQRVAVRGEASRAEGDVLADDDGGRPVSERGDRRCRQQVRLRGLRQRLHQDAEGVAAQSQRRAGGQGARAPHAEGRDDRRDRAARGVEAGGGESARRDPLAQSQLHAQPVRDVARHLDDGRLDHHLRALQVQRLDEVAHLGDLRGGAADDDGVGLGRGRDGDLGRDDRVGDRGRVLALADRTRAALAIRKARDTLLGNPQSAPEAAAIGRAAQITQADRFAAETLPLIRALQATGITTLAALATALNARATPTARGGQWHVSTVRNMLRRG